MNKKVILSVLLFFCGSGIIAQISPRQLKQFLDNETGLHSISLRAVSEVKEFYRLTQFHPQWIDEKSRREELQKAINRSPGLGLERKDYERNNALASDTPVMAGKTADSLTAEVVFTDMAIHFLHDLLYGNSSPSPGYNGLDYSPGCTNIPVLLAALIRNDQLSLLPEIAEPPTPGYSAARKLIAQYNVALADSNFREIVVTSAKATAANQPLLVKFYQLGIIDSVSSKITDSTLKEKIKTAQRLFNLPADGVLRSTTIEAINIPLKTRLKELNKLLNTLRWLSCARQQQKIIIVNIPSATLLVCDKDSVLLESRIIVGKRSTPTPTLCSKVSEVILYPYWMVPYSIATKELLPAIKRDINFLNTGNYQVINQQGKVMDPSAIQWDSLNAAKFPYIIRQSTGCDNALGLIKLNF